MLNYNYKFSYKNVTYYFNEPQLPRKTADSKIQVVGICSKCGKEQLVDLRRFKHTVDTKGCYMCYTCKTGDREIFTKESFPPEFNIEVLGPTYKNHPGRFKNHTKLKIECQECHSVETIRAETLYDTYNETGTYLCRSCKFKHTNLKIYGYENQNQDPEIKEKARKTNLKRYGVEHAFQSKEFLEKANNTMLQRYGVKWAQQSEEIKEKTKQNNLQKYGVISPAQLEETKEKARQTCQEKYGTDNYAQSEEFLIKSKATNLQKYGVENYMQLEEGKEKVKQTCLDKYGVEYYSQTEEYKEKYKSTCLQKYGVPHYFQSEEFQKKVNKKYKYKGINFDSSWELAYYIFNENNNIPTIRNPQRIEYYLNEIEHYYYPDFLVEGQLIEIKSSDMLNKDFSLKPPTKKLIRCQTEEEKQYLYDLCVVKTQCMRENNVRIISDKEIKFYLDYIEKTYGKNYLIQFQTTREDQDDSEEIDILDALEYRENIEIPQQEDENNIEKNKISSTENNSTQTELKENTSLKETQPLEEKFKNTSNKTLFDLKNERGDEDEVNEEDYYLIDHFCFTPEEIEEFLAEGIPEERII